MPKLGRRHMSSIHGDDDVLQQFSDSYGNCCIIHGFDCSGNIILETHSSIDPDSGQELDVPVSSFVAISPDQGLALLRMLMNQLTFYRMSF